MLAAGTRPPLSFPLFCFISILLCPTLRWLRLRVLAGLTSALIILSHGPASDSHLRFTADKSLSFLRSGRRELATGRSAEKQPGL